MDSTHFHIRWSEAKLDWEKFETRAVALARADELARPFESYTIEEFDDSCPACMSLVLAAKKTSSKHSFSRSG
jgi:hypothetical protein